MEVEIWVVGTNGAMLFLRRFVTKRFVMGCARLAQKVSQVSQSTKDQVKNSWSTGHLPNLQV